MSSANQSIARSPDAIPHPGAVDPAAEVRRGGDVRADRHDRRGHLGRGVREVDEEAAERLLGRDRARVRAPDVARHSGRQRDGSPRPARAARPPRLHSCASAEPSAKRAHGSAASAPRSRASCSHWALDSSAEWLAGCPSVGRPQALIVYAKITAGRSLSCVRAAERLEQVARGRGRRDRGSRRRAPVVELVDQPRQLAPARDPTRAAARAAPPRGCAAAAGTPRWASRRFAARSASPPGARTARAAAART